MTSSRTGPSTWQKPTARETGIPVNALPLHQRLLRNLATAPAGTSPALTELSPPQNLAAGHFIQDRIERDLSVFGASFTAEDSGLGLEDGGTGKGDERNVALTM